MTDRLRKYYLQAGAAAIALVAWLALFSVRETEFVLITQFGRPVRTIAEAGLHAKWPYQSAIFFDRRLRIYNPRPSEFLTRDKKNLVIDNYVLWRIEDPNRFLQTVGDPTAAEMRLHDIVWSGLSSAFGTHDLDAIVGVDSERLPIAAQLDDLTRLTDLAALQQYGIRIVDIRIKRLNLPEQNKQSVYAR